MGLLIPLTQAAAFEMGTAFTYQGELTEDGALVTDTCEFEFNLYDVPTGGTPIAPPVSLAGVSVEGGRFTVPLDFGADVFTGEARWLELAVCCPSIDCEPEDLETLDPRQELTPTPYALALPGLWTQQNEADPTPIPNLIGGYRGNSIIPGVRGGTIAGGGPYDPEDPSNTNNRVFDEFGTVCGGTANRAGSDDGDTILGAAATVSGGAVNTASGYASTVSGGNQNVAGGDISTIGGGVYNRAIGDGSTVAGGGGLGGQGNHAEGLYSTVGGGVDNDALADYSTVAGGEYGSVYDDYGTVAGGGNNQAGTDDGDTTLAPYATVGGGEGNQATYTHATVSGGGQNVAWGPLTTIGGGQQNSASGDYATVAGGGLNNASGYLSAIGGGELNWAMAIRSTIGGGGGNFAWSEASTIAGGTGNIANGLGAAIGGGAVNTADGHRSTIGGGYDNEVMGDYGTIAGGGRSDPGDDTTGNHVYDDYGTIGGGGNNQAGDDDGDTTTNLSATVGGGYYNAASGGFSTVAGGLGNQALGVLSTVPGGSSNIAAGNYSFAVGNSNQADGLYGFAAGADNQAGGDYSFAAGAGNHADAHYSFALGRKANTYIYDGAFVWADSTDCEFYPSAADSFCALATGGVRFVTATHESVGFCVEDAGVKLDPGDSAWETLSDRNAKENFVTLDTREVLRRLGEMPVTQWNYKGQDPSDKHIGPMAQDFYAAFGLSADDRHISTIDADGVALAAIQGLYDIVKEKDAQIAALEARLAAMEEGMASMGQRNTETGGVR